MIEARVGSKPFVPIFYEARMTRAVFASRNKRTGPITSPFAESGAFFRSGPDVAVPDLQLIFVVAIVDDHARKMHLGHGISCHVTVLRPSSRGHVGLTGADPRDPLLIDPRFFSDPADMAVMLAGAQKMQAILSDDALGPFRREKMLYPVERNNLVQLEADIRNRADSQYHPVGTCRMGPNGLQLDGDAHAVIDGAHGIELGGFQCAADD